jgi:Cu-Zn family superoxide dismutase
MFFTDKNKNRTKKKVKIRLDNKDRDGIYHKRNIKGKISIVQKLIDGKLYNPVYIIDIKGLTPNALHGIHIHENPVIDKGDLTKTCDSCGGHFNPHNTQHGSIFNDNKMNRHAGDLINNIKADSKGHCYIKFTDKLTSLYKGINCIIGRSIVIHEGTDDLGLQGRCEKTPHYIYCNKTKRLIKKNEHTCMPKKYGDSREKSSLENGNAGGRLVCANIIESI